MVVVGSLVVGGLLQGKYVAVAAAMSLLAVVALAGRFAPRWLQPSSRFGSIVAPILGLVLVCVLALAWWGSHGA